MSGSWGLEALGREGEDSRIKNFHDSEEPSLILKSPHDPERNAEWMKDIAGSPTA